jgi:hypothetical protein
VPIIAGVISALSDIPSIAQHQQKSAAMPHSPEPFAIYEASAYSGIS